MIDVHWVRFGGCGLLLFAFGATVRRSGTVLFGLSVLNVFMVASATLSVFFFGTLLDELPDSFTADHLEVVSYSIVGLLAMVTGIYLAWHKRLGRAVGSAPRPCQSIGNHVNQETGWLTFCIGAAAEMLYPFVYSISTVSTAVYCISTLGRIGLCMLLVTAMHDDRWARFCVASSVFALISIVGSFASGFTFIRINVLLPLIAIWCVGSRLTIPAIARRCVLIPICGAMFLSAVGAWLETRALIRFGLLEQLPVREQAIAFFSAYWDNLRTPTAVSIMHSIAERVDMTEILAAQVRYQPEGAPYAYGQTLMSSLFTLIPRALWSDKPVVAGGSAFVADYTGLKWNDMTSVGLPYPFELYANGGPLFVVVGLGVIGYACARLELRLVGPQNSLGAFWAVALVTAVLTEGGQRMDVVLPALVASAIAAYSLGTIIEYLCPSVGVDRTHHRGRSASAFGLGASVRPQADGHR